MMTTVNRKQHRVEQRAKVERLPDKKSMAMAVIVEKMDRSKSRGARLSGDWHDPIHAKYDWAQKLLD